jgi:Flp pilus assembly pilin Flp
MSRPVPHVPALLVPLVLLFRRLGDGDWRSERGQATTEYALVLLAAALIGVLVIGWATAGGGAAAIGRLFDRAINSVIDQL